LGGVKSYMWIFDWSMPQPLCCSRINHTAQRLKCYLIRNWSFPHVNIQMVLGHSWDLSLAKSILVHWFYKSYVPQLIFKEHSKPQRQQSPPDFCITSRQYVMKRCWEGEYSAGLKMHAHTNVYGLFRLNQMADFLDKDMVAY